MRGCVLFSPLRPPLPGNALISKVGKGGDNIIYMQSSTDMMDFKIRGSPTPSSVEFESTIILHRRRRSAASGKGGGDLFAMLRGWCVAELKNVPPRIFLPMQLGLPKHVPQSSCVSFCLRRMALLRMGLHRVNILWHSKIVIWVLSHACSLPSLRVTPRWSTCTSSCTSGSQMERTPPPM